MKSTIQQTLESEFYNSPEIKSVFESIENDVLNGKISPVAAVEELIRIFRA